jgi:hypothetical protein
MKRVGNLYQRIYSPENIILADKIARKGKAHQYGVLQHDKQRGCNIFLLAQMLRNKDYITSPYSTFSIYEPKERQVFACPTFRIGSRTMLS